MRSVVTIVVALVLSACAKKGIPPSTAETSQAPKPPPTKPVVPPRASDRGFSWTIQVRDPSGIKNYGPEPEKEIIPIASTDWACTQNGLKTNFSAEGDYIEIRDVTCKLKTGHAVGGRTLCTRDPSGKVTDDTQVLGIADNVVELKIIVMCAEASEAPPQKKAPANSTPPDPVFTPPPTLSL